MPSRPEALLFFVLLRASFNSDGVKGPVLMSSWCSTTFFVGLSRMSGGFPYNPWKCFCQILTLSWLLFAFSLALFVVLRPLISFTICHAIADCLLADASSISFVLELRYACCSSLYVVLSSALAFFSCKQSRLKTSRL